MLCDDCKKRPASVHFTKIINDQRIEKNLCEECTGKYGELKFSDFGLAFDNKFPVQDLLKGIFGHSFSKGQMAHAETACEICKMIYSDFSRSGKIGCSNCYTVFGDLVEPIVRRVHSACGHTGKAPVRTAQKLSIRQKLNQLRQELDRLVDREEYEIAAKVRDKIRKLQQSLQQN